MTKFAVPLVGRTSVSGQLGAVLFLALGLFVACGNDIPERTERSSGGASGRTNSTAGKPGKGGEAGEAGQEEAAGAPGAAGNGDAGVMEPGGVSGGSSGKGGTSGNAGSSGKGGTGGSGPACGNSVLESGEMCDDGNTSFGDSCSPTCTNTCEKCEKDVCWSSGELNSCDDAWSADAATAKTGPGVGKKKSVLCNSLVACLKRTGCAQYDPAAVMKKCYCGSASAAECAEPGKPNGACSEEIAAAGEERAFNLLSQRLKSPQYALGVATLNYGLCDGGLCANECVLGKANTECQKCAAIAQSEHFAACYANPTGDPKLSAPLCTAVMDCAHRTRCAADSSTACYGTVANPTGPCATELTAASQGMTPAEIFGQLNSPNGPGPLVAAANVLAVERDSCKEICFPTSSGGQGGSGGGSAGGGHGGTGG